MALLVFRQYIIRLIYCFFLKGAPSQVLQNGVIFINVNVFHHFDTCDTIYSHNFQKQLIHELVYATVLSIESKLFLT